ncbi:MAG: hypothetical protein IT581_23340 [Verrucomicrobiales bacterium]|nr:hypothetical protein [Verrucomicrobiales bacterium]
MGALVLALSALQWTGAGCVTSPGRSPAWVAQPDKDRSAELLAAVKARDVFEHRFPGNYRCVQRAVVTVGRRQFTCDGVLTAKPGEGHHLAVVSALGVVTDVRVGEDGACEVGKVTPLMREQWSRDYVARDLQVLFSTPRHLTNGGRLADGSVVLQAGPDASGLLLRYAFTPEGDRWEAVEMSRNGRQLYHARVARYRQVAGAGRELPSAFEVFAETYQLSLQAAEWRVEGGADTGGRR